MRTEYEAVIGLECHAQLRTESKLFCACPTKFGEPPNMNTCPVCTGLPGALPVLNRSAVELAIKAGLGLNCRINSESEWSRKNYFYPDLPKGYQISQYDRPIAEHGRLEVGGRDIRIRRIHMEEDAGKSLHEGFPDSNRNTYLDFNRAGTPLVEIVSEPDLRTPQEAHEYLSKLKEILEFLEVCDGNMEEGSLRCDANVSIRPRGTTELGIRTEIKNINSMRFLEKAIEYEIERQTDLVESGGHVTQETRLWNANDERTVSMRSKEDAHDYRYFPEPDLPLLVISDSWLETVRRGLPELPAARRARFTAEYGLSAYDAGVLTATSALAAYFEATARASGDAKAAANWVMGDLLRLWNDDGVNLKDLSAVRIQPVALASMIGLVARGVISGKIAKTVIEEMHRTGKSPEAIVEEQGLVQISDSSEIEKAVDSALAANPDAVAQFRSGKTGALGFLVGQVMKATGGRANPKSVNEIIRGRLAGS